MATATKLKQKAEERARVWDKMQALRTEIGTKAATSEQRARWDRIEADLVSLGDEIDTIRGTKMPATPTLTADEVRYAGAFGAYLRGGTDALGPEDRKVLAEHRAQSEGTNTAGGYLVPQGYWVKITETMKAYGGLLSVANVIQTATGNALPWPSNNDTANVGALLSENTQVSEVDLTLGTKQLNAWTYTSNLVLASLQLLQDSAFDLDAWLPGKLGTRIGRAVANHLVNGTGTSQPTGLLTGVRTGVTGATGQTASVTYANLIDMEHSVDAAYRQAGNCRFLMNDVTLGAIRKIVDSTGRPLWTPGFGGFDQANPETVLGYPVQVDNAMPTMAANAKSIVFGDFEAGYVVRQVLDTNVIRLTERYSDFLQVGWIGFARVDGNIDDAAATAAYVNSAT